MTLRTCLMRTVLPLLAMVMVPFLPDVPYALSPAPTSSSSSLPRRRATCDGSFSERRPAKVARTTLCGLSDPSDLVRMFWIPADSTTARTAPPAMMPVPSGAGFRSTLPAPKRPSVACGRVVPASGTRTSAFFADSMPFLIADGTSFALPMPKPTCPWPSPTKTRALKLRFLPPLTTFVTRLIETTVSFRSSSAGSIFWLKSNMSELQPCFARRVGDRLHAAVVQEAAAVEHHAADALGLQPLGDGLADRLGAAQVAGLRAVRELRLQRRLGRRGRHYRGARVVVDHLCVDVRHAAEHRQARPLG